RGRRLRRRQDRPRAQGPARHLQRWRRGNPWRRSQARRTRRRRARAGNLRRRRARGCAVNWYQWISDRRALVWMGALALAAAGAAVALRLPSGIYPEVEFPRIVVVARGGDAPPELTQISLTRPLENTLATVLGVERIRSHTIRGAVEMSLLFAP